MSKFRQVTSSFQSGEVGPRAQGQVTRQDYFESAEELINWIPLSGGGIRTRPPTFLLELLSGTDDGASNKWIIPFTVNKDNSYLIYFNPDDASIGQRLRIFRFQNRSFTEIPFANINNTLSGSGDLTGYRRFVQSADTMFLVDENGLKAPILIRRLTGDRFSLTFHYQASQVIFGGTEYERFTTYFTAFPYLQTNTNGNILLKPSGTTGNITITAEDSSAAPINFFTDDHVGSFIKITHGSVTGVAFIVSKVSGSVVNATVQTISPGFAPYTQQVTVNFGATTASDNWEESAWNNFRGFPRTIALIEGRLIFGGNKAFPDTVWASRTGNLFFMMASKLAQDSSADTSGIGYFGANSDSDPFDKTLTSATVDNIAWMIGERFLAIGTEGGEYLISGGGQAISNTNFIARKQTSNGGKIVETSDDGIYFVTRTGDGLVEFMYSEEGGGYRSQRLDYRNREIVKYTGYDSADADNDNYNDVQVEQIFWNRAISSLFLRTSREKLIGLTIDKITNMYAFFRCEFGGSARVISSCNLLDSDGYEYTVLLTGRDGLGLSIEAINKDFQLDSIYNNGDDEDLYRALDCSSTGVAVAQVLTLADYANEEVRVINLEDGTDYGLITANGSGELAIPVDTGTDLLCVGYDYECKYKSLPVIGGGQYGPAAPSIAKIDNLVLQLYKSRGLKYGFDYDSLSTIPNLSRLDTNELFTGYTEELALDSAPSESQQFYLVVNTPAVCTILNLGVKGETYEG